MIERMLWKEHRPAQPIYNVSYVSLSGVIERAKYLFRAVLYFPFFVNQVFYYYKRNEILAW